MVSVPVLCVKVQVTPSPHDPLASAAADRGSKMESKKRSIGFIGICLKICFITFTLKVCFFMVQRYKKTKYVVLLASVKCVK